MQDEEGVSALTHMQAGVLALEVRLLGLLAQSDQRYDQRFRAQEEARIASMIALREAVALAAANAQEWRQNANEWRGSMDDRERHFMPRAEAQQHYESLNEKFDLLNSRMDKNEGRAGGMSSGYAYLLMVLTGISTLVAIGMSLRTLGG